MDTFYSGNRRGHRTRRKGGNPPKIVVSNPAWNLPKPGPKPNSKPNPGGRKKYTRKNRRRRGGAEAEQKELLDAIKSNKSLAEIQAIVSRGADVNTGVGMQAPPLTWAIHKKRLDLVKFLVENGADVNRQSPLGGLPILEAGDYPEILGFLISRGARYPAGWPMSARTRKIMEKQGAIEVGVKKDLPTPVPSIIKGFLGGAEPADGELFRAIQSQSVESVHDALDRGADPNAVNPDSENTPLIEAVHTDEPKLVQLLIDAGAQVDTKGSEGGTALYWAADNMPLNDVKSPTAVKIQTIMKILLKHGADAQLVYDALKDYPAALSEVKAKIERLRNPQMAIEVGVKKDLPPFIPGMIRGFLGSARRRR